MDNFLSSSHLQETAVSNHEHIDEKKDIEDADAIKDKLECKKSIDL